MKHKTKLSDSELTELIVGRWYRSEQVASACSHCGVSTALLSSDCYTFHPNGAGEWIHDSTWGEVERELFTYCIDAATLITRNNSCTNEERYRITVDHNHLSIYSSYDYCWEFRRMENY